MSNSTNEVGKKFLHWLAGPGDDQSKPEIFLESNPEIDGQPITEPELKKVVARAADLKLIRGLPTNERDVLLRVRLTPSGHDCVEEYGGDMRRWLEAQRGGGAVTHNHGSSYNFEGVSESSIVAGSKNVEQHQTQTQTTVTVKDADLLHRIGLASHELANLAPGVEGAQELREAAMEVQSTAKDPEKTEDAGKAGKRLKGALTTVGTIASVSTIAKFLMDNLDLAVVFQ
ncbi:hypothetical protein [Actinomycetospora atypica]|uniref:Uncharacterized protein n=1 Tax=Actinomycetospora atypica TaxID=1290095 RepID=A0ABV9YHH0_9PSEU